MAVDSVDMTSDGGALTLGDASQQKKPPPDGPEHFPAEARGSFATQMETIWSREEWYSGFFVACIGGSSLCMRVDKDEDGRAEESTVRMKRLVCLWKACNALGICGLTRMCAFAFACYIKFTTVEDLPLAVVFDSNSQFRLRPSASGDVSALPEWLH